MAWETCSFCPQSFNGSDNRITHESREHAQAVRIKGKENDIRYWQSQIREYATRLDTYKTLKGFLAENPILPQAVRLVVERICETEDKLTAYWRKSERPHRPTEQYLEDEIKSYQDRLQEEKKQLAELKLVNVNKEEK